MTFDHRATADTMTQTLCSIWSNFVQKSLDFWFIFQTRLLVLKFIYCEKAIKLVMSKLAKYFFSDYRTFKMAKPKSINIKVFPSFIFCYLTQNLTEIVSKIVHGQSDITITIFLQNWRKIFVDYNWFWLSKTNSLIWLKLMWIWIDIASRFK